MKYAEALMLKKGDLVVVDIDRVKSYGGLVLEVVDINTDNAPWHLGVTLKQPGFDNGFCLEKYNSRLLKRLESV